MSITFIYFRYILAQIIPSFLIGLLIFLAIIMMAQFLQLTEFILIHNVGLNNVLKICGYMCTSFLPVLFPMSLLFSVLLTYARLAVDSELVAFKSMGCTPFMLALPGVLFSILVSLLSGQALFTIGPAARHNFDELISNIGNQQIMSSIKAGTFSESFFGLVLYANQVDEKKNKMTNVFIYDGRQPKNPVTIVAKNGTIGTSTSLHSQNASIFLSEGSMITVGDKSNLKLDFATYRIGISAPIGSNTESRDTNTYTMGELGKKIAENKLPQLEIRELSAEWHRRIAMASACLIFGILGYVLGAGINRRSGSSTGFILSVGCVATYWLLYAIASTVVMKVSFPPPLILWIPNALFAAATLGVALKKT